METLHDKDHVHGDLREPKVLITTDGLKLVDFDWCESTVRYLANINLIPDIVITSGLMAHSTVQL